MGGLGFALPRSRAPPSHGSDRSAHFGTDPTGTDRRLDPLEQLSACQGGRCQSIDGHSILAAILTPTPPFPPLNGQVSCRSLKTNHRPHLPSQSTDLAHRSL